MSLVCKTLVFHPPYEPLSTRFLRHFGTSSKLNRSPRSQCVLSLYFSRPLRRREHFWRLTSAPHLLFHFFLRLHRYSVHSNIQPFVISNIHLCAFCLHGASLFKYDARHHYIANADSWPHDTCLPPEKFAPVSFVTLKMPRPQWRQTIPVTYSQFGTPFRAFAHSAFGSSYVAHVPCSLQLEILKRTRCSVTPYTTLIYGQNVSLFLFAGTTRMGIRPLKPIGHSNLLHLIDCLIITTVWRSVFLLRLFATTQTWLCHILAKTNAHEPSLCSPPFSMFFTQATYVYL